MHYQNEYENWKHGEKGVLIQIWSVRKVSKLGMFNNDFATINTDLERSTILAYYSNVLNTILKTAIYGGIPFVISIEPYSLLPDFRSEFLRAQNSQMQRFEML